MSDIDAKRLRAEFVYISLAFWAFVILMSAFWQPVYGLMQQVIIMHSEYSLLEQGTKVLLLVMFFASMIAYSGENSRPRIFLGLTFTVFALALYFSESNFIVEMWQPVVGAVFILIIMWRLLNVDRMALAAFFLGCFLIGMGVISDVLLDRPELLPTWNIFHQWQMLARSVEEHFDIWGVAFISYSSIVVFRVPVARVLTTNPRGFVVLLISIGLIASGNSFAHWQYRPSWLFELIATALAGFGILGVAAFDRSLRRHGQAVFSIDKSQLYFGLVLVFLVLPIIYGGTGAPFNLVLWIAFFLLVGKLLYDGHPTLATQVPAIDGREVD